MELKSLHKDAIPSALAKAERYRLLHEPFGQAYKVREAKDVIPQLKDEYERAYYSGIVSERRAQALLHQSRHASGSAIYDWLREAMDFYEKAEAIRPPANDDALLRWNTCARLLTRNPHLQPGPRERSEPIMSE
jgi:hypothetical protein